jgi:SH3 domain-containing YSC84-like protein 1
MIFSQKKGLIIYITKGDFVMRRINIVVALLVLAQFFFWAVPTGASDADDARILVEQAKITLETFVAEKDNAFFQATLKKAKGILIFPKVVKVALGVGGGGGSGIYSVRNEKTGEWSQPAFYSVGGGSFGFQAGAQTAEIVVMALNQKATDSLFVSTQKWSGSMSAAAGLNGSGINKTARTDFISFAKTAGLYAGVDLQGTGVSVRDDINKAYYGRNVTPVQILVKKEVSNPASAPLLELLKKVAGKGSK